MIRNFYLWCALAAFALLNVAGEALHHAEIFGLHTHERVSSCDCAYHEGNPASPDRDGVEESWQECDHTCALCQYYSQAKPGEQAAFAHRNLLPPATDLVLTPRLAAPSGADIGWFARGPPLG